MDIEQRPATIRSPAEVSDGRGPDDDGDDRQGGRRGGCPAVRADERGGGDPGRLGLLASALAGRGVEVAAGEPGEPAWTDGSVVFIDGGADRRERLEALAVQASLLAAGSLEPDVVRRLVRRPAVVRRYLAVEGHRALAVNQGLLPSALGSLIDGDVAGRGDSPAASLAAALGREAIAEPPGSFGAIRPRQLLAAGGREGTPGKTEDIRRQQSGEILVELDEDAEDIGNPVDLFTSPGGRGGALGRLLQRMLGMARQLGGGAPGAEAPTHRTRSGSRGIGTAAFSTATPGAPEDAGVEGRGTTYPEWDVYRRCYRQNWCTVQEVEPRPKDSTPVLPSDGYGVRRPLGRLGMGLDRCHRQVQGDDIDIDAAVEAHVETIAGSAPEEAVYIDGLRRRRDLSVLLLLDVSGSVAEPGAAGRPVHEHQRAVAAALAVALHELGDRVALYAYQSRGRSAVHLMPVKRFDDGLDILVMRRLYGLVPTAYLRLGAAIRHGAAVLEERGGTSRRLLVVLSDGLAYDHGYERVYGAADARRALAETRRGGTGCLCLTVGAGTDAETLRRVFGSAAHATIPRPEQLRHVIGPLFRAALRSADARRGTP
jgi:hypothetical protein